VVVEEEVLVVLEEEVLEEVLVEVLVEVLEEEVLEEEVLGTHYQPRWE